MSYREFPFNWRATMGNADKLSPAVTRYLDLVGELAENDPSYLYRTANWHTCAVDDPMVLLDHAQKNDLCVTPADHRLFDQALTEVRLHRREYMDDAEIERRMKQADGSCPMCGAVPSFAMGDYGDGYQPQTTGCNHTINTHVRKEDIDAFLRRPRTWHGRNWPYPAFIGTKVTDASGKPFKEDHCKTRCLGCQMVEARFTMEQAIFALINCEDLERFTPAGWSLPVSEYRCKWGTTEACKQTPADCDHVYMHVKRAMSEAHDSFSSGSHELRLNGAGLKLYIQPARHPFQAGKDVTFGLRVGGDQVGNYPGFREFAHELFERLGVPSRPSN